MDEEHPQASGSQLQASQSKVRTRVWRACEVCRKRKIKCDGQDPCAFCATNKKECTFTEPMDHASGTRQITSNMESRLRALEQVLAPIAKAFKQWEKSSSSGGGNLSQPSPPESSLSSPPQPLAGSSCTSSPPQAPNSSYIPSHTINSIMNASKSSRSIAPQAPLEGTTPTHNAHLEDNRERLSDRFSHLTKDSLGNLRFIGGASSLVLVEALESLQASHSPGASPESTGTDGVKTAAENLQLPFFRPNMHFRRFDVLPQAEETVFPPPEVSDRLVETYFARIHHTFPILHKQGFVKKYVETMKSVHSGKPSSDHAFLSSLFAVFACAESISSSTPSQNSAGTEWKWTGPSEYAGLEYYERSMVLFWVGSRLVSMENIQCLALLAICCAGWNTLSQSWMLAGQAIRAAQDLGLHRSPRRLSVSKLEKEHRRRIWWCVYGLDHVLSISLGRPMGTNDSDSDVEYPAEVDDDDLEAYCDGNFQPSDTSFMCGFVALLKVYVVAGKIVQSAHSLQLLKEIDETKVQVPLLIQRLDSTLEEWVESLPENVKYAANRTDNSRMLTLCLIAFFVYYSATINLHRPFIPDPEDLSENDISLTKCISAARACIRIGDMVKSTLPASHHLAYAVQQICISGVVLLRVVTSVNDASLVTAILVDAERCCRMLEDMQDVWPGARRCKEIVSELLVAVKAKWERVKPTMLPRAPPIAAEEEHQQESVPDLSKKRKAQDQNSSPHRETRMRLEELASAAEEQSALMTATPPYTGVPIFSHEASEFPTDFDMSALDPMLDQSFSGYDFLGNDLEVILGRVQAMGQEAPQAPSNLYDAQMLWDAWEGGGFLAPEHE